VPLWFKACFPAHTPSRHKVPLRRCCASHEQPQHVPNGALDQSRPRPHTAPNEIAPTLTMQNDVALPKGGPTTASHTPSHKLSAASPKDGHDKKADQPLPSRFQPRLTNPRGSLGSEHSILEAHRKQWTQSGRRVPAMYPIGHHVILASLPSAGYRQA